MAEIYAIVYRRAAGYSMAIDETGCVDHLVIDFCISQLKANNISCVSRRGANIHWAPVKRGPPPGKGKHLKINAPRVESVKTWMRVHAYINHAQCSNANE